MIIVVDDDVLVRAVLRRALEPHAVCVPAAGAALELARSGADVDALIVGTGGEVEPAIASLLLRTVRERHPEVLCVLLRDPFDVGGAALHGFVDATWSRTTLDGERLARWIQETRCIEAGA
jgi:CheY-like chemotaxis protein